MSLVRRLKKKLIYRKFNNKVNLFIVGEQKCGTSSLHSLLVESRKIVQGTQKEMHFFDTDEFLYNNEKNYEDDFKYNCLKKSPIYAIDSSPSYAYLPYALKRIKEYNADAKIIYLTRDPIERFFSAFRFYKTKIPSNHPALLVHDFGKKISEYLEMNSDFTLNDFFELEKSETPIFGALERGCYSIMIKSIFKNFPIENVFIADLSDFKAEDSFRVSLNKLEGFLGIKLNLNVDKFPQKNISSIVSDNYSNEIIEYLNQYYDSCN